MTSQSNQNNQSLVSTHKALILDTETTNLSGVPIQIAYVEVSFQGSEYKFDKQNVVSELYSCEEDISIAAMAVHNIIKADLEGKPHYSTFKLPHNTLYLIGHNIDFDMSMLEKCYVNVKDIRTIDTLSLARQLWEGLDAYNLSAMMYFLLKDKSKAREVVAQAHDAGADILMNEYLLRHIIHKTKLTSIEDLYQFGLQARIPTVMPFGKHKGQRISNLPVQYCQWALENMTNIDAHLRAALQNVAYPNAPLEPVEGREENPWEQPIASDVPNLKENPFDYLVNTI